MMLPHLLVMVPLRLAAPDEVAPHPLFTYVDLPQQDLPECVDGPPAA